VVIALAAYGAAYAFAKQRHRRYTNEEKWKLIWICFAYLMLFEACTLWFDAVYRHANFSPIYWIAIVALTAGLDFLALWIGYTKTVTKMFERTVGAP
jgi:rod shape-determining protein MreD